MAARQDGPHLSVDQVVNDKLCSILGVTEDKLMLDSPLDTSYDMDSLDVIQFVMDLEDVFGIEIPDEEARSLTTLRQVIASVKSRLPSGTGPAPRDFEIRDAYEVYSVPSSWSRRDIVGRVWDKALAEKYVADHNNRAGRPRPMLHWSQTRVIFIRGSWYAVLKTPLAIKNSI